MSCSEDSVSQHSSAFSSFYILPASPSLMFPETPEGRRRWPLTKMVHLRLGIPSHLLITNCEPLPGLLPTAETLFWPRLRAAHASVCRHRYLEGSLTTWPFSKRTVAGSSGPVPSQVMGCRPGLQNSQAWNFLLWNRFHIQSESSWLPHVTCATVAVVATPSLACQYWACRV